MEKPQEWQQRRDSSPRADKYEISAACREQREVTIEELQIRETEIQYNYKAAMPQSYRRTSCVHQKVACIQLNKATLFFKQAFVLVIHSLLSGKSL